jgi:Cu(I)/Ag(I) efflux system periplasmic protein CusF
MFKLTTIALCTAVMLCAEFSYAQPAAPEELAQGEVRRIDREGKRITLRHGEIKSLAMPPMTMVFGVGQASQLDGLEVGARVRFTVRSEGGKLVVERLEKVE